ncbi:MAG TPA: hypothetical protein VFR78_09395 [Pyrinomonadaceae bacterium]|nr:hypothetical protein [Pyrinomonadaceae bacterium]
MSTTAILILISIAAVGIIFWIVVYSGRRGEMHRARTTIKPTESNRQNKVG